MQKLLLASFALPFATATSRSQDVEAGESLFRMCSNCHAIGVGAGNRVGPELNGLDGRKAGSLVSFTYYSDAVKKSGITWNDATSKEYIQNPKAKIPGTTMFVPGIADEKKIFVRWAYIKQFGADGNNEYK